LGKQRLRSLELELARTHPAIADPQSLIAGGAVRVDGRVVTNPRSLVRVGAAIVVRVQPPLRGEAKLEAALAAFPVRVAGRVALDVGAAAGGFTKVLLRAGAARVYAVDAGHGQLAGALRQDERVVSLERVNLGALDRRLVPDSVDVVTFDLSYLSVARAAPQLRAVEIARRADLVALVKPMFELGLPAPPEGSARLQAAVDRAARGLERAGWCVLGTVRSPVAGSRGAVEFFVHARKIDTNLEQ
jgi:23S rRNA (cytidine1920-2'-O)/16S rRNA (cytidine1409-2'-O)-methyltransferase